LVRAKVDAELNEKNLVKTIGSVAFVADMMEQKVTGKDEY
jgi:hypothetical protein